MLNSFQSTKEYSNFLLELSKGGVCVFPTDTVVGIGCLAFYGRESHPNTTGVDKIFGIKKRDVSQKLPWLVKDFSEAEIYAEGDLKLAKQIAKKEWPGHVTLVVPVRSSVNEEFCVKHDSHKTLAMRCPNAPFLLSAIEEIGSPIVCSSANISGEPAVGTVNEVSKQILEQVDFVYEAKGCLQTTSGTASKIYNCCGNELIRLR